MTAKEYLAFLITFDYFLFLLQERSGSTVPSILNRMDTTEAPPTYNKVNKFTEVFQGIVDSYGVANYREVNPGMCSTIQLTWMNICLKKEQICLIRVKP